ncbi:hypothetical protein Golax_014850, partial [Gossypium laxum]|nr:hypothetical protein [Gossypium laxum]
MSYTFSKIVLLLKEFGIKSSQIEHSLASTLELFKNVTEAELWGFLDGLKLILDRGFKRILIQKDSLEVAFAIQEGAFRISNTTLLRRIKQILTKVKQQMIQHIPREENTIADSLVKKVQDR